jgi:hypothetical protein
MSTELQQAIAAIKAGDEKTGRRLLSRVLLWWIAIAEAFMIPSQCRLLPW